MSKSMATGYRELVADAEEEIETIDPATAHGLLARDDVVFVDVRDVRELRREGRIPGSFHCPRGMLEFWIDPESPYAKDVFARDVRFVFYCNLGWRSALAARTAARMGLARVCHIGGGYDAWTEAGLPTEALER